MIVEQLTWIEPKLHRLSVLISICLAASIPAADAANERYERPLLEHIEASYGPGVLGWVQQNEAAKTLKEKGDLDEAEEAWMDSLDIARQLGPKDPRIAESMSSLGQLYVSQKRLSEAEKYLTDAINRKELIYGIDSKELVSDLTSYESVLSSLGENGKAKVVSKRISAIESGPASWLSTTQKGKMCLEFGEAEEAEECLLKSLELATDFGEKHWTVAESHSNLGHFYLVRKQREKAEEQLKQAIALKEVIYGADSIRLLRDLLDYSKLSAQNGDPQLSRELKVRSKNLNARAYRVLPISSHWTETVQAIK